MVVACEGGRGNKGAGGRMVVVVLLIVMVMVGVVVTMMVSEPGMGGGWCRICVKLIFIGLQLNSLFWASV